MNTTVETKLTTEELRQMVDSMVEEKLVSILGDDEDHLEIRDEVKARLLRQRAEMKNGQNSVSFEEAMTRIGLAD
ncbi:MAG: hypothetical protein HOP17_11825 [Acidobacteria bacterium]|nr:hypothetical protein [Acidobacteriota bacterium]